ncbi:hypothetical protein CTAYLR_007096 [Chrysophaeum taylorii]|uniref:PH domain-containing protein n=1 Tax=Chrysophaeum taylorii TaxID=2483200 RepID=A0AAD7UK89_9STRA|nr:hypothetical protein CTAYLR_007096 [Chrysophaeum taylorii]
MYGEETARTTGSMLKKGGGRSRAGESLVQAQLHRRNWQRRWFVLDVEEGELHYYKDASLGKYKGCVRLTSESGIKIPDTVRLRGRHRPTKKNEDLNYFEIHDAVDEEGRERRRPFALRAPNGEELLEWLMSLQACLGMLRQERLSRPRLSAAHLSDDDESDDDDAVEAPPPPPALLELPSDHRGGSWRLEELRDALLPGGDDPPKPSPPPPPPPVEESPGRGRRKPPPPPPKKPPPPPSPSPPSNLAAAVDQTLARRSSLDHRREAVDALVLATGTDDADAIFVSIEHAIDLGVDDDHAVVVAARSKLKALDEPQEAREARRHQLELALDRANDREALGDAIADAVAFGFSQDSRHVQHAQARLCALLSAPPADDDDDADLLRAAQPAPDNITRLFLASQGYAVSRAAGGDVLSALEWGLDAVLPGEVPFSYDGGYFSRKRRSAAASQHNEMGYGPRAPRYVAFGALLAAELGGETTLVDGHELFESLAPQWQRAVRDRRVIDTACALTPTTPRKPRGATHSAGTRPRSSCTRAPTARSSSSNFSEPTARLSTNTLRNATSRSRADSTTSHHTTWAPDHELEPEFRVSLAALADNLTFSLKLATGTVLVVDNFWHKHGRSEFRGERHMLVAMRGAWRGEPRASLVRAQHHGCLVSQVVSATKDMASSRVARE